MNTRTATLGDTLVNALEAHRRELVRISLPAHKQTPFERATSDALMSAQGIVRDALAQWDSNA